MNQWFTNSARVGSLVVVAMGQALLALQSSHTDWQMLFPKATWLGPTISALALVAYAVQHKPVPQKEDPSEVRTTASGVPLVVPWPEPPRDLRLEIPDELPPQLSHARLVADQVSEEQDKIDEQ